MKVPAQIRAENIDLNLLTVDDLLVLRDRVTKTLSGRIEAERHDLEMRLARLNRADLMDPFRLAKGGQVIGRRAVVMPKYQNPDSPLETWAGRGRQPRWIAAALKAGKKLSDFEVRDKEGETIAVPARRRSKPQNAGFR